MSDKRKIIITIFILILFLGLSVFFWLITKHWYWGLTPSVVFAVIEIAARRYKKGKPEAEPNTLAQSETEPELITSISVLLVKDFIACCADNNLSVLGNGTPEQLQTAFESILSQYYEIRSDEGVKRYKDLMREISLIELHRATIAAMAEFLRTRYSFAAAEILRSHYPLFKFEKDTYEQDLNSVGNLELKSGVRLGRLKKQLEALEQSQQSTKKATPEQIRIGFINRIADINKVEAIGYDMLNKTVMEFAVYENRLTQHIENLQKQAKSQR